MNKYSFKLDLDKGQKLYSRKEVVLRQGDKGGCEIEATLYDHGQPFTTAGLTAYFVMELPNGGYYYRDDATYTAGVCDIVIDESRAAAVPGVTDNAYFEIRDGTTTIATTEPIRVTVLPSATAGNDAPQNYDENVIAKVEKIDDLEACVMAILSAMI